jgi:hypothetical protein
LDTARGRAGADAWQDVDQWQDGDPWRDSLARSRARRVKSKRSSKRARGAKIIAALALAAVILTLVLTGGGTQTSPSAANADAPRRAPTTPAARPHQRPAAWRDCPLAIAPAGYVNPLQDAIVKPERIDQGVDYAGIGKLVAIGAGRITDLASDTDNSGWPGAFIEYQLLSGADAGCYVYYAEGVTPAAGLGVGDTVSAGEPLATIIPVYPTGIEIGWGAGVKTKAYAKVAGQWTDTDDEDNIASAAGKSFSALIAALGGPPGKNEGGESGSDE